MESEPGNNHDKKFLVYESHLMTLFNSCPSCAGPTNGELKQVKGSFIVIYQECGLCGMQRSWSSQPLVGAIPAGNLEMSCALLFSGSLPSKTLRLFQFLNMASISYRSFMSHQQSYLHPAILQVWSEQQDEYKHLVLECGQAVHIGGDGRADSPGHSAKFGSYTLMDLERNQIVDLQLVQSNEVRGSTQMEKEGLVRGIEFLQENGIEISHFVSDRHLQVAKWVRENMPNTRHNIDVWHVAKGLKKKLLALSKERDCEDLAQWIKSLTNHLYWVPSSTPEDAQDEVKWEKWTSISNHVQNVHVGHGDHFPRCEHPDLDQDARRKRWLAPGSKVMTKLEAIFYSRQMRKDIPLLSPSMQTANLEAYHSVINHFAPKMNKFSFQGMQSRLILAALHYNENASREQATTRNGDLRYKIEYPKAKNGEYTVKKVKTRITYDYVNVLRKLATTRAANMTMPRCEPAADLPPLCEGFYHPDKEDAVNQLLTRYQRN